MREEHPLLWRLEDVALIADLSVEQKEEFLKLVKAGEYRKGETIFLPGDPGDTIYFLQEGLIKIYQVDETGKCLTLLLISRKGQPFGLMALAGQEKRDLIAKAVMDCRLCLISKDSLLQFAEANPKLCLKIIELIGSRRKQIENKLADIVFHNVPARLARLLVELAREFGKRSNAGRRIEIRFTHQELAELIGASREHVTTTLNRFEREKLLERSRKQIIIKDKTRLGQIVDERR